MAFDLNIIISNLESMGFYQVALPFILVFTIIFGVLQKTSIFGSDSKKFNLIIALVTAFLVIRVPSIVSIFNTYLPRVSLIVLVIISAFIVLGIFGVKSEGLKGSFLLGAVIFSVLAIGWALAGTSMQLNLPPWLRLTTADQGWLIGIAIFVLLIYFITREGGDAKTKAKNSIKDLDSHLGRGGN